MRRLSKIILIGLLLFTGNFLSCNFKSPAENVKIIFNSVSRQTTISVDIFDSATGVQIGLNSGLTTDVEIAGPDKDKVTKFSGEPITSLSTNCGLLHFCISENNTPSEADPIQLSLLIEATGYVSTNLPITLFSSGNHSYIVNMVNKNNPPTGVNVITVDNGVADASGQVAATFQVQTAADPLTNTKAIITIPAGTVVTNANGAPLTGNLQTTIVYFNGRSEQALRTFPGGFFVNLITEDGSLVNENFITCGWADIQIKDMTGKTAKYFDPAIKVNLQVPGDQYNWLKKTALTSGDEIPAWHYVDEYAYWAFEGNAVTDGPNADGVYNARWQTKHLSKVNLDFPIIGVPPPPPPPEWPPFPWPPSPPLPPPPPPPPVSVTITIPPDPACYFETFVIMMKRLLDDTYFYFSGYITADDPVLELVGMPCNIPVRMEAWAGCPLTIRGYVDVQDLCSVDQINISTSCLSGSAGTGELINVPVTIYGYCASNPDVLVAHSIGVWTDDGCGWKFVGMMENGKITLPSLEVGRTYSFGIYYEGEFYQESFVVTQDEHTYLFELPAEACN